MKIFVSLLTFAMTLALTSPSLAEESHGAGGAHDKAKLGQKMNSLFPTKQADLAAQTVPAKPDLTSPAYFEAINGAAATLKWKAAEGAEVYHVQVATDSNFKWLVAENKEVKDTSFEVSNLEAGKHYFWRVASVKPNNWSTFRKSYFATSMFETSAAK